MMVSLQSLSRLLHGFSLTSPQLLRSAGYPCGRRIRKQPVLLLDQDPPATSLALCEQPLIACNHNKQLDLYEDMPGIQRLPAIQVALPKHLEGRVSC